MAMNVEAEIRDPKRRVSEIKGSFGFLTQQIKSVHKDLLAFQARTEQRLDKIDGRLDKVDGRLDKVDGRLDLVEKRRSLATPGHARNCRQHHARGTARAESETA
jgi:hypothetical protein